MITTSIETITPEKARALLSAVPEFQRNIRKHRVAQIVNDIRDGRWEFNGESIVISESGELIDGQHRCAAVVAAEIPIQAVVVRGVKDEAYDTIDKGLSRSVADGLKDMPSNTSIAAAAKAWLKYDKRGTFSSSGNFDISAIEIQRYARANFDALHACVKRSQALRSSSGKTSIVGYAFFERTHMLKYGIGKVEQFISELCKGVDSNSPAIKMYVKTQLQGRVNATHGDALALQTLRLLSYTFEKWNLNATNCALCRFEQYDLRKIEGLNSGLEVIE